MTRRSMPCLFHANLFALGGARWHCQNIDVPNDYVMELIHSAYSLYLVEWRYSPS